MKISYFSQGGYFWAATESFNEGYVAFGSTKRAAKRSLEKMLTDDILIG